MAINVTVEKHGSESSMSLIRRFTKRVQGAGIVRRVKGARYRLRIQSQAKRRVSALRRVLKHEKNAELERMGLEPKTPRGPVRK